MSVTFTVGKLTIKLRMANGRIIPVVLNIDIPLLAVMFLNIHLPKNVISIVDTLIGHSSLSKGHSFIKLSLLNTCLLSNQV